MTTTPSHPAVTPITREGESILFPELPFHMHERNRRAVHNDKLLAAVEVATLGKDMGRKKVFADLYGPRYDHLRTLAGQIKQHTLDHLDHYLEQFIDNAEQNGITVHFAADAAEANTICLEIAQREKCTCCVKAKSMVTEEVHLLPKLEAAGIETFETDLAEFILQIDNDAPSHIVTAMIHKDRYDTAAAFQRVLGVPYETDPTKLTMIARQYLREKYRKADLGISGGNFLVADAGSLVLCTNEGNATFCVTAPRVHIAMVGIEKLVPTYEHLAVMLKLLARSSTAQPMTVYTDIVSGPKHADDADGPQQVHIILIDNGRTKILADETMRQTLRCIRCGACLNACPVYRKVTGHSYGAVYSGPIGSLITPMFRGLQNYKDLPYASSLCGACGEACPVKIDIPRLLIELRNRSVKTGLAGRAEKLVFDMYAASLKHAWSYRMANAVSGPVMRAMSDGEGYITKAPGPFRGWTDERDLPVPAEQSFRAWWKQNKGNSA